MLLLSASSVVAGVVSNLVSRDQLMVMAPIAVGRVGPVAEIVREISAKSGIPFLCMGLTEGSVALDAKGAPGELMAMLERQGLCKFSVEDGMMIVRPAGTGEPEESKVQEVRLKNTIPSDLVGNISEIAKQEGVKIFPCDELGSVILFGRGSGLLKVTKEIVSLDCQLLNLELQVQIETARTDDNTRMDRKVNRLLVQPEKTVVVKSSNESKGTREYLSVTPHCANGVCVGLDLSYSNECLRSTDAADGGEPVLKLQPIMDRKVGDAASTTEANRDLDTVFIAQPPGTKSVVSIRVHPFSPTRLR